MKVTAINQNQPFKAKSLPLTIEQQMGRDIRKFAVAKKVERGMLVASYLSIAASALAMIFARGVDKKAILGGICMIPAMITGMIGTNLSIKAANLSRKILGV